ncbi:MAG: restriction endonuclease [Lysobacteraceae bacterium]
MQTAWLIALAIAVAAAVAGFLITGTQNGLFARAKVELSVALEQMRSVKWQEFASFVVALLEKRGLVVDQAANSPDGNGADILMKRGNARYIVHCKHGSAYRLDDAGLENIVRQVQHEAVSGAILVNAGTTNPGIHERAASRGVDVLEGEELWQQMEPGLPFDLVERIHEETTVRIAGKRKAALAAAGLFALIGGMAGVLLTGPVRDEPVTLTTSTPSTTEAPPVQRTPAPPPAAEPATPGATGTGNPRQAGATSDEVPASMPDPNLSEADLADRREQAEKAVIALTGVRNANWSTRSTMVVVLSPVDASISADSDDDPLAATVQAACAELVRYEELRYTRLQISHADPRDEAEARVRWRQCR